MRPQVALISLLALASAAAPAQQYFVTPIGLPSGSAYNWPGGINESGQIAGYTTSNEYDNPRAYIWEDGQLTLIGSLGGKDSQAFDINDDGVVVGGADDDTGLFRAFRRSPDGTMMDIGTPQGRYSFALGISNAGHIVGSWPSGGFIWQNGAFTNIPRIGEASDAFAVTDDGYVVGTHYLHNYNRAFLWQNGSTRILENHTALRAVNARHVGAGTWLTSCGFPALYTDSTRELELLPTLPNLPNGGAEGINDRGEAVGYVREGCNSRFTAVLWKDHKVFDLNAMIPSGSGWGLERAMDINERGQIIGIGRLNNRSVGFLLTPVPEPSSMVAAAIGLTAILGRRRAGPRSARTHMKG